MPRKNSKYFESWKEARDAEVHARIQAKTDQDDDEKPDPPFHPMPLIGRTTGHQEYLDKLRSHRLTVCIGFPGTGKTWHAAGYAAELFNAGRVDKIVMVRPLVSCGDDLGPLPGDINERISPYLAPLNDALGDFISPAELSKMRKKGQLIGVPLQIARGMTFRNSVVILDEAQNVTSKQMFLFLTRIGQGTKMIINGDARQDDLPARAKRGLLYLWRAIHDPQIARHEMTIDDIVRDPLVKVICEQWKDED